MSGGHYNYKQDKILDISEKIESKLRRNEDLSEIVKEKFRDAIKALEIAYIYAQRVDWFLSYDDSEDSFLKRLKEQLEGLEK